MPDMLVSLLDLPDDREDAAQLKNEGINIRRVQPYEASILQKFIAEHFSQSWADEIMPALAQHPISCFIATRDKKIIGFAAYECTRKDFFGPMGVDETLRGKGVGKALLLACLRGMLEMGYAYAIIGGAGPVGFYSKCASATEIPGSVPGIYVDGLG